MLVSARSLKWLLRFYPPLFLQRIWVVKIDRGFKAMQVKISRSLFNLNYNRSIFGGTIFSAADVCYPVLFHQLLSHNGYKVAVWSRSAHVHFIKKSSSKISFVVSLSNEEIDDALLSLHQLGRYNKAYPINIYNDNGDLCANITCEVYVRDLNYIKTTSEESIHKR